MSFHRMTFFPAVAAAVLILALPSAVAGEHQTPAAGACKSALPVYDGNIRSRPMAVQNEGASSAFVTCAQRGDFEDLPGAIGIGLTNTTDNELSINCTLVTSLDSTPSYIAFTRQVPAGSTGTWRYYRRASGTWLSPMAAFSCNLPPGAGVSAVGFAD